MKFQNTRDNEKIFKLQQGEKNKTGFPVALDVSTVKHLNEARRQWNKAFQIVKEMNVEFDAEPTHPSV